MAQTPPTHTALTEEARDALVRARSDPKTPPWILTYLEANHERLKLNSEAIQAATSVLKSLGTGDEAERHMLSLVANRPYHRQLVRRD